MRAQFRGARQILALPIASLVLLAVVGPVSAATPQSVTIVSHVTFNPDGPNYGDFQAFGPAVDNGVVCPAGTFVDTYIRFGGFQSNRGIVQIVVGKALTCDDGSGTFNVQLRITANFDTGFETFTWVVLSGGTGDYSALRGGGNGSTVPNFPPGNINTYTGFLLH